jgi:hypothetical protein
VGNGRGGLFGNGALVGNGPGAFRARICFIPESVDNDGIHGAISKRGEIELDEGVHSLRVRYFQGMKYELALQLFVKPPDAPERLFRAAL